MQEVVHIPSTRPRGSRKRRLLVFVSLEEVLGSLGGVAPTHVLRSRGVSRWEIDQGVDGERITRVRRGVLALHDAAPELVTAVCEHARLSCVSAASYYDLWRIREPQEVHLSRTDGVDSACVNHRTRSVPVHPRLPLVGLADVLVHVLQCQPEEESAPIVECALRRGHTVPSFLETRLPGRRNGKARFVLAKVGCTADSAIEVVARLILTGAGLDVRSQVPIPGVGRVDFLVENFLVVEVDGAAYHSDRQALQRDLRRNNTTIIGGYALLRFTYEDVIFHPEELLAQVLQVLGRRPVR